MKPTPCTGGPSDPAVARFVDWGSRSGEESAVHLRECLANQASVDRERDFLEPAFWARW